MDPGPGLQIVGVKSLNRPTTILEYVDYGGENVLRLANFNYTSQGFRIFGTLRKAECGRRQIVLK